MSALWLRSRNLADGDLFFRVLVRLRSLEYVRLIYRHPSKTPLLVGLLLPLLRFIETSLDFGLDVLIVLVVNPWDVIGEGLGFLVRHFVDNVFGLRESSRRLKKDLAIIFDLLSRSLVQRPLLSLTVVA